MSQPTKKPAGSVKNVGTKNKAEEAKARAAKRAAKTQRALERAQRRKTVFDLRLMGQSVNAIAEQIGVSKSTVMKDLEAVLDTVPKPDAKRLYTLQLERYDSLLTVMMTQALGGDQFAVDRAVNIMRQIERLTGIEQPNTEDLTTDNALAALRSLSETIQNITQKE